MPQSPNAYATILGLFGSIIGLILPFWMGWATLDLGINVAAQTNSFAQGLIGPLLIGLTSAIVVGLFGALIGMMLDGSAKKSA